jgi:ADP-ribosyl-[dinitrogen reductase] hydrolase
LEKVLLGTAAGDSLGLPAEGLSPARIAKRWPGAWRQRFFFGRGMVSDDTEHTVFVAQCLADHPNDVAAFQRALSWKLRWWLLCLPAGVGFATLRAVLKLWVGFPAARSGVFSAGNGPAMRSAIIGAKWVDDPLRMEDYLRASTRLTHTDPRAETAARAVAQTAAWAVKHPQEAAVEVDTVLEIWSACGPEDVEWQQILTQIRAAQEDGRTVKEFAALLGADRGVSGYAYRSVPVALYAWLRHDGDFRSCLEAVLCCGGDTDTVAAIAGALAALRSPIPAEWLERICDYPISLAYLRRLARQLEMKGPAPRFGWPVLPIRNVGFLIMVLVHGFRRLVPF